MGTPADTTSGLNVAVPTAMRANAAPDRTDPLGGVDGDPHPVPQAVYVSRAGEPEPPETAIVEESPAPSLSWQQQVDAHRAEFGLAPLEPAPASAAVQDEPDEPAEPAEDVQAVSARRVARLAARRSKDASKAER